MRKFLFLLIAFAVSLQCVALTVDGVNYTVSGSEAIVTGATSKSITRLVIPATITSGSTTYKVTQFSLTAFVGYSSLKELVIEDSEDAITTDASNSQTSIVTAEPFIGCPLEKIYIGRPLAIRAGNGWKADITKISSTAEKVDLTFGGKAEYINGWAFENMTNLYRLTIGGSISAIYNRAFKGCTGLKTITFEPSDKEIAYNSDDVFEGVALDSLIVKRNLNACRINSASNLIITPEVDDLSAGRLFELKNQEGVNFIIEDSEKDLQLSIYGTLSGDVTVNQMYIGRHVNDYAGLKSGAKIINAEFGPAYTEIPKQCFFGYQTLKSVKFPENLTAIGEAAFDGCSSLTDVALPDNLKQVDASAFSNCSIANIILPDGLETIGQFAFNGNPVSEWIIPASVNNIGYCALASKGMINKVVFNDGNNPVETLANIFSDNDIDSLYIGRQVSNFREGISSRSKIANAEFGPAYTEIPKQCFFGHQSLKSVKFPENLTVIGEEAFTSCSSLTDVALPANLKQVDTSAFSNCSIANIILPDGLETIGQFAFNGNPVSEWIIPASVNKIDYCALASKGQINKVVFNDGNNPVEMPANIFSDNNIDSLYIGRQISNFRAGISSGSKIANAEFGPAYTEIPKQCFFGHTSLKSIRFPESIVSIGEEAFNDCNNLTDIFSDAKVPPTIFAKSVFNDYAYDNATVTVPRGTKKLYSAAEYWTLFKNLTADGGYVVTVDYDHAKGEVSLNGVVCDSIVIDEDEALKVVVSPSAGHRIESFTANGRPTSLSPVDGEAGAYAIAYESLEENMHFEVALGQIMFGMTMPATIEGGKVLFNGSETCPTEIAFGSSIKLTFVPDEGYNFQSVIVNGVDCTESCVEEDGLATYTINEVTDHVNISAVEFAVKRFNVSAEYNENYGTVQLTGVDDSGMIAYGSTLTIKCLPARAGCFVKSLTVDGVDMTDKMKDNVLEIDDVRGPVEITALFDIERFNVSLVYDSEKGYVNADAEVIDGNITVEYGDALTLTIIPDEGFEIENVTVNGNDLTAAVDADGTIKIDGIKRDTRVEIEFAIRRLRLTVLGLQGGNISMGYLYGDQVRMFVEAEDDWTFHSLSINGEVITELDEDQSFTIDRLTDDTVVNVVFEARQDAGANSVAIDHITVSAVNRTIIISGADDDSRAEVYDTAGIQIYNGTDRSIGIDRQGVFIVRISGKTYKVMLK